METFKSELFKINNIYWQQMFILLLKYLIRILHEEQK